MFVLLERERENILRVGVGVYINGKSELRWDTSTIGAVVYVYIYTNIDSHKLYNRKQLQ